MQLFVWLLVRRLNFKSSAVFELLLIFWKFHHWHVVYELIRYQNNENEYQTYFIYLDNLFKS